MKNVYFVQPNMMYGKALYFPYAVGCLAAYAWKFDTIKSEYNLGEFLFKREPVEKAIKRIKNPAVIGFSCYTWTYEYNKTLAKMVKELYPDCYIIFGGHNVSENVEIFSELPFVDALIYGEGEIPFKQILDALSGRMIFSDIKNIEYREDGKLVRTEREYYTSVDEYPSPYLEGYFETISEENPDTEFCAVLETNRGCPYNCSYCDWCYSVDLRQFDIERVKAEIVWCANHRVEYIFCADSNFGILKRDYEIAQFAAETKKKIGYPHIFNTCFAKNSNDTVFEISKLFYDNKLNKAATLAYQSVSPEVLKNVNRKNFTMDAFASLVKKYNQAKIPTYTEMILGLPGETYDSFCDGLCSLMQAGQQSALTVYYCQVYPNSLMGTQKYREEHGIQTAKVPLNYLHSTIPDHEDITEYTNLIVGTKDMPFEDLIRSIIFCTCLQCFHHIGLLKFFAIYANYELNINFRDFYDRLLDFIFSAKGTHINKLFENLKKECSDFSNGEWSYYNEKFGNIGWFLEEGMFMEIICEFDKFWDEILPFLSSLGISDDVFDELLKFQKFAVRMPNQETVTENFKYDFMNYFDNCLTDYNPLRQLNNTIEVKIPNPVYNWKDYARKVMLFAKRRGECLITNDKRTIRIVYSED